MAYKGVRVEAGRPVTMLLQMSRQEMMGTWTSVAAVEAGRNGQILDIF